MRSGNGEVDITLIPEPSTLAFCVLCGLSLMLLRNRNQKYLIPFQHPPKSSQNAAAAPRGRRC
jgi:hypothetical protein